MDKDINVKLGAVSMASDPSLDLPPQIEALLNMGSEQPMNTPIQSYQEGGMIQPAGVQAAGMPAGQPMNNQMMEMQINQSAAQNPELIARVRAGIEAGLKSGEITMEDLNMAIELARTVAQNPAMYPQVRQFVIQKGLATAEELPEQYDEAIIIALLIAAKAMSTDIEFEGQAPVQPAQSAPVQDMQDGGVLKGPSHDQGGIPVKVSGNQIAEMEGGEYVIPKNVVKAKGTEFFDKMLANYEDKPDAT
jgi:hypothetical protein